VTMAGAPPGPTVPPSAAWRVAHGGDDQPGLAPGSAAGIASTRAFDPRWYRPSTRRGRRRRAAATASASPARQPRSPRPRSIRPPLDDRDLVASGRSARPIGPQQSLRSRRAEGRFQLTDMHLPGVRRCWSTEMKDSVVRTASAPERPNRSSCRPARTEAAVERQNSLSTRGTGRGRRACSPLGGM
jgi:hypothetical protein